MIVRGAVMALCAGLPSSMAPGMLACTDAFGADALRGVSLAVAEPLRVLSDSTLSNDVLDGGAAVRGWVAWQDALNAAQLCCENGVVYAWLIYWVVFAGLYWPDKK